MDTVKFQMRLPVELVARIDAARDSVPRAAWLRRAAEERLAGAPVAVRAEPRPARVDLARDPEATVSMCRMCVKAGPPRHKPCPKCGSMA